MVRSYHNNRAPQSMAPIDWALLPGVFAFIVPPIIGTSRSEVRFILSKTVPAEVCKNAV